MLDIMRRPSVCPSRAHCKRVSALLLSAVLWGGCAGDDGPARTARATAEADKDIARMLPNLVDERDVASTVAGSPERALLEWFQAVQFEDLEAVRSLTDPAALPRAGRRELAAAVAVVGPALGKPTIVTAKTNDDRASVRALIRGILRGRRPRYCGPY